MLVGDRLTLCVHAEGIVHVHLQRTAIDDEARSFSMQASCTRQTPGLTKTAPVRWQALAEVGCSDLEDTIA